MLNAGLLTAAIVALAAIAGQNTKDVRGWHGAEWGMNAEQLKGAVGMTLEPTTDGSVAECKTGTPGSTLFRATTAITVGTVSGSPKFCVTKRDGLVYIHMDFGAHAVDFSRIRGELILYVWHADVRESSLAVRIGRNEHRKLDAPKDPDSPTELSVTGINFALGDISPSEARAVTKALFQVPSYRQRDGSSYGP